MPADLSKLSDDDLVALKSGDLSKVSNEGLLSLKGDSPKVSAAEQIANDPITKGAQEVLAASPADLAAAHPIARLGLGAISPVLGAAQLAAEALGNKSITEYLKNLEDMKQRGIRALGDPHTAKLTPTGPELPFDSPANNLGGAAEVAGNLISFAPLAKIAPAATVLGKIGQGAGVGAAAGASAPVTSEDYWGSKGGQILAATALGAAIPGGMEAGKAASKTAQNIFDMFTKEGAKRILTRYQGQIVGEQNLPKVIETLKSSNEIVPLTKPTAAEVLSQVPEGSPIVAHQRITAETPGGVSARFGQRVQEQQTALGAAEQYRDQITRPLREGALKAANKGGIEPKNIIAKIDEILSAPEYATSDIASKSLNAVKDKINEFTNSRGLIDAEALYGIRKNLGETIGKFSAENAVPSKKMTAGLEKQIQASIDSEMGQAIKDGGGSGDLWRRYLNEYAMRSKNVEKVQERIEMMYKPPQKTNVAGGADVAGQMRFHGPQMLSRPMMATNWVLKKLGENVEKKIDPEAARRYLDPQALASELESFTPNMRKSIVHDLVERGRLPAIAIGASQ